MYIDRRVQSRRMCISCPFMMHVASFDTCFLLQPFLNLVPHILFRQAVFLQLVRYNPDCLYLVGDSLSYLFFSYITTVPRSRKEFQQRNQLWPRLKWSTNCFYLWSLIAYFWSVHNWVVRQNKDHWIIGGDRVVYGNVLIIFRFRTVGLNLEGRR